MLGHNVQNILLMKYRKNIINVLIFTCELCTSNMTGCRRGLKHKLRAAVACAAHFANSFNFLITEGYCHWLQFSIPCAYFVYTV